MCATEGTYRICRERAAARVCRSFGLKPRAAQACSALPTRSAKGGQSLCPRASLRLVACVRREHLRDDRAVGRTFVGWSGTLAGVQVLGFLGAADGVPGVAAMCRTGKTVPAPGQCLDRPVAPITLEGAPLGGIALANAVQVAIAHERARREKTHDAI